MNSPSLSSCIFSTTDTCWSASWQQEEALCWSSGQIAREDDKDSRTGLELQEDCSQRKSRRKSGAATHYKHVPHRDKPQQLVERRNARERRRVQAVNLAFTRLRKVLPIDNRGKRVSKVKTLHKAIEYIGQLQQHLLAPSPSPSSMMSGVRDVNKENSQQSYNRWSCRSPSESNGQVVGGSDTDSLVELLEDFDEDF